MVKRKTVELHLGTYRKLKKIKRAFEFMHKKEYTFNDIVEGLIDFAENVGWIIDIAHIVRDRDLITKIDEGKLELVKVGESEGGMAFYKAVKSGKNERKFSGKSD